MRAKKTLLLTYLFLSSGLIFGQKLLGTSSGEVHFYSDTPLETIQATNKKTACLVNTESGEIAVQMRIVDFIFPNKLMQEHFNENYLESEKYPTAQFKGIIAGIEALQVNGIHALLAEGNLTIHGVSQPVKVKGTIEKSQDRYELKFSFLVRPEDYKVEIPNLVLTKIAEEIEVSGTMNLTER
ncbi:YceI family protein [Algoriphagus sp. CAU 1675]|uniref:YceI family protein n=1 Tax=Algoriphagus sp. CAU 1675 TaxID=3032597 RepID=UPI0023DCA42F|nr:YceI family protein [Algoriphagus sp. CAU 1675]MDF2157677.1 YceI family protein [Algoriphagus sp. CAU 1675]